MSNLRQARSLLQGLRHAAALEERLRRMAQAARPRNPRELEAVEVSPGVWAVPVKRAPSSKLGRLTETFGRVLDVLDDNDDRGRT